MFTLTHLPPDPLTSIQVFEALFLSLYLAVIILWVRFVADDDRVRSWL